MVVGSRAEGVPDGLHQLPNVETFASRSLPHLNNAITTGTLSEQRRSRLAWLAEKYGFLIVENDILGMMPETQLPSLFSLQPRKTVYVTGTSKVIATGIRLGFLAAPTPLLHPLMSGVRSSAWMPSPLILAIFAQWVEQGIDQQIISWHRQEIAARLEIVKQVLGPNNSACDGNSYHAWMPLADQHDLSNFADHAFERGLLLSPSETFTLKPDQEAPRAVRISLGFPNDRSRLELGLRRLAELLNG